MGIFGTNPITEKKVDGYLRGQVWNRPVELKKNYRYLARVRFDGLAPSFGLPENSFLQGRDYSLRVIARDASTAYMQNNMNEDGIINEFNEYDFSGNKIGYIPTYSGGIFGQTSPMFYDRKMFSGGGRTLDFFSIDLDNALSGGKRYLSFLLRATLGLTYRKGAAIQPVFPVFLNGQFSIEKAETTSIKFNGNSEQPVLGLGDDLLFDPRNQALGSIAINSTQYHGFLSDISTYPPDPTPGDPLDAPWILPNGFRIVSRQAISQVFAMVEFDLQVAPFTPRLVPMVAINLPAYYPPAPLTPPAPFKFTYLDHVYNFSGNTLTPPP